MSCELNPVVSCRVEVVLQKQNTSFVGVYSHRQDKSLTGTGTQQTQTDTDTNSSTRLRTTTMEQLVEYLPQGPGILPKWLFFVSVVSAASTLSAYANPSYVAELYNGRTSQGESYTNAFSGRVFGTWNLVSCVVRMYAAYNIAEPVVYDLAMWTFGIALLHFTGEWLIFGTAQLKGRFVSPMIVASSCLLWMFTQRGGYLG
ncbi:hypothetical protein ASPZODRAFT_132936 [Penicilliopsis zonata CBS 506.65]|uniref:Ergosterol biosynthesis protein Erg28 n=1 Tax=Penicilliopsis zonata CBS 506.65 TaxID=1073090 RepID=A0A1L9SHU2_9EURO|nr:hypothetical protein ASPZODRAFT_132936 [Penicilliopsis zonata CBS 506.65]OJJ46782.1 hypothetical protein ASPZODRAFT_132936 [Penicilliopsis zonata CBS 506.65]